MAGSYDKATFFCGWKRNCGLIIFIDYADDIVQIANCAKLQ